MKWSDKATTNTVATITAGSKVQLLSPTPGNEFITVENIVADSILTTAFQAKGAGLTSISGLTTTADQMIYTTASDTYAVADLSSFARTLLDDANASTARGTLGLVIGTNVQAYNAKLSSIAGLTPASSLIIGNGLGGYEMVTPANFITNNNILDTADIGVSVQAYNSNLTGINQALTTTSSPTFVGLTLSGAVSGITTLGLSNTLTIASDTADASMLDIRRGSTSKSIRFENYNGTNSSMALTGSENLSAWGTTFMSFGFGARIGRVGFGTKTPSYTVDVSGTLGATGAVTFGSTVATGALTVTGAMSATTTISAPRINGSTGTGTLLLYGDSAATLGVTLKDDGNTGFGTSDIEAWLSGFTALEFGASAILASRAIGVPSQDSNITIVSNAYYDGSWKRKTADLASRYRQVQGVHTFSTAVTSTIDSVITWVDMLTINATGLTTTGTLASGAHTVNTNLIFGTVGTYQGGGIASIYKTSNEGLTITSSAGATYDFLLTNGSGQTVMRVPTGTTGISVIGASTFASTLASGALTVTGTATVNSNLIQLNNSGADPKFIISAATSAHSPLIGMYRASGTALGTEIKFDNTNGWTYLDNLYDNATTRIYIRSRTRGTPVNNAIFYGDGSTALGGNTTVTGTFTTTGKITTASGLGSTVVTNSNGLLNIGRMASSGHLSFAYASETSPSSPDVWVSTTTASVAKFAVKVGDEFSVWGVNSASVSVGVDASLSRLFQVTTTGATVTGTLEVSSYLQGTTTNGYLDLRGDSGASLGLRIDDLQNVVCNSAAIATTATNGFLYIPSCAGAPTGVPTTYTGRTPMVFDTTNNKLMIYDGGWIGVTLA